MFYLFLFAALLASFAALFGVWMLIWSFGMSQGERSAKSVTLTLFEDS